jgi:hypothetical protein
VYIIIYICGSGQPYSCYTCGLGEEGCTSARAVVEVADDGSGACHDAASLVIVVLCVKLARVVGHNLPRIVLRDVWG